MIKLSLCLYSWRSYTWFKWWLRDRNLVPKIPMEHRLHVTYPLPASEADLVSVRKRWPAYLFYILPILGGVDQNQSTPLSHQTIVKIKSLLDWVVPILVELFGLLHIVLFLLVGKNTPIWVWGHKRCQGFLLCEVLDLSFLFCTDVWEHDWMFLII